MFIFKYIPKFFGYLLRKKTGLSNLKFFFCGGAPLNIETEKFFNLLGLKIIQGYGLSETSPLVTVNPLNKSKLGSVGKVIKTCSVRIDKNNKETNGKIFVKGPNVFKGYFKNEFSTSQVLKNNELDTGDIGRFDEEGYLYITGREKFIILGPSGENIYPEQIEELVDQIEFVEESVVFSKDQKKLYVLLKLYDLMTKKNTEIKTSIEKINRELEVGKRISKVYIYNEEFPKTSTQKIKRDFVENIDLEKLELVD
jgi:long-chain acyl-CoA synthetase